MICVTGIYSREMYSHLFHMLYLNAWELPCFALSEWVHRCCTELFDAFLARLVRTEVILIQPEDSLIPLFKAIVYWRSWVRKLVNISSCFGLVNGCRLVEDCNGGIFLNTEYDTCQTLHDGTAHWALPVHTNVKDLDCIYLLEVCQFVPGLMTVTFFQVSPDVTPSGWLGSEHQLTN